MCQRLPALRRQVEKTTCGRLTDLAEHHPNGTAYWRKTHNDQRIHAFYISYEAYDAISEWNGSNPTDKFLAWRPLDHGYDESKPFLDVGDLRAAAAFRGGRLLSSRWNGELYSPLNWQCAFGHRFQARPYTVIKAGHWCPECFQPPWNFDQQARVNPYFAQVWYADHDPSENNVYPEDCAQDIHNADLNWRSKSQARAKGEVVSPAMSNCIKKV